MPLLQTKGDRDSRSFKVTSSGAILQGLMDPEMRDIASGDCGTGGEPIVSRLVLVSLRRAGLRQEKCFCPSFTQIMRS